MHRFKGKQNGPLWFLSNSFVPESWIHLGETRCVQTALRLAVSLWPCSTLRISTLVSWLLRRSSMLSEPQHQSLYGHSWQTPTSALLVNILGASVLSSSCLCAPHPRALIRASGNQKTESLVTDRERKNKKTKAARRRGRMRGNIKGRKNQNIQDIWRKASAYK